MIALNATLTCGSNIRAIAILGIALATTGCDLIINKPPAAYLNRCLSLPVSTDTNPPLSMLVRSLEAKGLAVSWSSGSGQTIILTGRKTNPLNGTAHAVVFGFQSEDSPRNDRMECGPGIVRLTGGTYDGQELSTYEADDAVTTFIDEELKKWAHAKEAAQAQSQAVRPRQPQAAASASNLTDSSLKAEAAADANHYAQLDDENRGKAVSASFEGPSSGLTLGQIESALLASGARTKLDSEDFGNVWLDIEAPAAAAWHGYAKLNVEFARTKDGQRLFVSNIKAGDRDGELVALGGEPDVTDFLSRFKRD